VSEPVTVLLAGAPRAPLAQAAEGYLRSDPRVTFVGRVDARLSAADVQRLRPDLLVSAAYRYLIPPTILALPRLGAIGIHPSLLPRDRGSHPLWWALRRGDPTAGVTVFHLAPAVDAGAVIDQVTIQVRGSDTFASLYARAASSVPDLLRRLVDAIESTGCVPAGEPQDESQATYVTRPGAVARAVAKLRWSVRPVLARGR
jgi:methionyl-tRNA formyltransferase